MVYALEVVCKNQLFQGHFYSENKNDFIKFHLTNLGYRIIYSFGYSKFKIDFCYSMKIGVK